MDVVIHSMAVSDFGFKPISEKLKSNDPDAFIESLKIRIFKTPKILSQIKKWIILINQSNLDENTQRNMILKCKTGRTETEWKNFLNEL